MMWLLARLYHELPEVGDVEKPKLVFFFDEAHLLFDDASKAFLDQVEQVVRLIRSKGVGVFFITQNPKDVPPDILGPARAPRAARPARLHPRRREGAQSRGAHLPEDRLLRHRGDPHDARDRRGARHRAGSPKGMPTPPFATRLIPPAVAHGPARPSRSSRAARRLGRRSASTRRRSTATARARCCRGAWRPRLPRSGMEVAGDGRGAGPAAQRRTQESRRAPWSRSSSPR